MDTKRALILLGHGSRTPRTSVEMGELAAKMQGSGSCSTVSCAFLTLLDPDLPRAIQNAVEAGADQIRILPLFIFSGKHVLEDIPALFREAKARHPQVKMELLDPIGHHPDFSRLLLEAGGFA